MSDLATAGLPRGDMKGVRIGWRPYLGNERIDAETLALCEAGVKALAGIGATLTEHDAPFTNTLPVWGPLTFSIWASRFGALAKRLGDRMRSEEHTSELQSLMRISY